MIKQLYHFLHPKFRNLFLKYDVDFKPRYGYGRPPHPELLRIIEANRGSYKEWIAKALSLQQHILTINDAKTEPDPLQPVWNNGFLPGLDIVMLYTLITECKPKRYVEIGSGNSTKVAYKAKKEQSPDTEIISIDPKPRAEIDAIANEIVRTPFENINYDITGMLQENDILFVDNSHRIL
ncbi:MAG: hypothetical protein RQ866_03590, partial [Bacteroidales bacterium]|nr:hypothetical protein [Bacteroidales bacterium]